MAVLTEDNAKPLEDVLACAFPNYDLTTQSVNASEAQHDSSISSAEDSDDSDDEDDLEEYDFSGIDWCIKTFLFSKLWKFRILKSSIFLKYETIWTDISFQCDTLF